MPLPALAAIGTFAAENPLLASLLASIGYNMFGQLTGSSPAEQAAQQQIGIGKTLIPQLQAQAMGQPTMATEMQMRQIKQQGTRMGQSYAASAQRQGIPGTTPARAQQGRMQVATAGAMGDILGQAQQSAQAQLGGLYAGGVSAQQLMEQQKAANKQAFMGGLGEFMGWYRENKADAQAQRVLDMAMVLLGLKPTPAISNISQQWTPTEKYQMTSPPYMGKMR